MDLLDKIGPSQEDTLLFVGDLITKGPKNQEVLDFFLESENAQSVLGNHEYALLMHYRKQPIILKRSQRKVKKELGKNFGPYMQKIAKWPLTIPLENNGVLIHAGIRPDIPFAKQTTEDLTNIRTINGTPWFNLYKGTKTIVFGHWVTSSPIIKTNAIGIDTGCVYGGRLTALIWPEKKFVSVKSRDQYNDQ